MNFNSQDSGAETLLKQFLLPGADHEALSRQLRPTTDDYRRVFKANFATRAEKTYTPPWDAGDMVIKPKSHQTELLLWSATSADLKQWNKKADYFPGGYRNVADQFNDGITVYRFKFVKPGEALGMAYDGLIRVNGQWRIFPKPYRIK